MTMLIRLGYDIRFELPGSVPMVALLNVHPSRVTDLLEPDELQTEPRYRLPAILTVSGIAAPGLLRHQARFA